MVVCSKQEEQAPALGNALDIETKRHFAEESFPRKDTSEIVGVYIGERSRFRSTGIMAIVTCTLLDSVLCVTPKSLLPTMRFFPSIDIERLEKKVAKLCEIAVLEASRTATLAT